MTPDRNRDAYGAEHGIVCANIVYQLKKYLEQHPVAHCFAPGTGFVLEGSAEVVRTPDVALVRNEHMPNDGIPTGYFPGTPDLAIIVVSPNDKFDEIAQRVRDYFDAGSRRVWIVRPRVKMVTIHRSEQDVQIIAETQTLNGGDILPGLEIPLTKLFV
jgi:Uma2 family endonuclease